MEKVTIGKIINTRGLKGEVKVSSSTSFSMTRFKVGNKLVIYNPISKEEVEVEISKHYVYKGFDYLVFKGLEDINKVEKYKTCLLIGDKLELDNKDEFYYSDLVGLEAIFNGKSLGKVAEVFDLNDRSILRIKGEEEILVLFMDQFIEKVDLENSKIYLKNVEGYLWK